MKKRANYLMFRNDRGTKNKPAGDVHRRLRSAQDTDKATLPSGKFRAYDFSHLSVGDLIEARQGQKVHHRGPVDEALPALGLFWMQDTITSTRRLVDFDAYEVFVGR